MHAHMLSPKQAGAVGQRARKLLSRRLITPYQFALLETLLWGVRKPGCAVTSQLPMKDLARLAGQAKSTVIDGLRVLEDLRLIARIKRRVRMAWTAGAVASRVVANAYRLLVPDTETACQSARDQPSRIIISTVLEAPFSAMKEAQDRLATIASRRLRAIMARTRPI